MFNQAPRCAFLLALAAGLAENRVQAFHVAAPARCGSLCRGMATDIATYRPPHAAVRGCTCGGYVVAAAGFGRGAVGGRTRGRGHVAFGMSMEASGAPAAAVPEFELSDKAVEV